MAAAKLYILTLVVASLASCASQSGSVRHAYPWLLPGATTVESLPQAESELVDTSGDPIANGRTEDNAPRTLRKAIEELLSRSPRIAASRQRYRAAIERVPQASTLPRPVLSHTYLPWPVETRVGPNEHRIQLAQAIPFPSKLVARHDAVSAMARAAEAAHDRLVRDEITALEEIWADLYYYDRALDLIAQNEQIAKSLSQIAAERHQAERGTLFDLSKAQSQLAQLGYDRIKLQELRDTTASKLNAALSRPSLTAIGHLETLPAVELAMTRNELLEVALKHQQEIRGLDARIQAADARLGEARSAWIPDFGVGIQYLLNGPARMSGVQDSGQDAVGLMFSVELPVWFADNAARVGEADANLAAAFMSKKAHLDDLQARLDELLFRERDARRLRTLYDEELLPQAIAAIETAEQWQTAEATRFTDFLEARGVYYSFALARERAVVEHFKTVARIEQLIGARLAPKGGQQ